MNAIAYTTNMKWSAKKAPLTATCSELCNRIISEKPTFEFLNENRRLYFDVDVPVGEQSINKECAIALENKALEYAMTAVKEVFGDNEWKYALATSNGEAVKDDGTIYNKYSVRLWFPEIRGTKENLQMFVKQTNRWIDSTKDEYNHINEWLGDYLDFEKGFFDEAIYDKNRKMRCIGTSKPDEDRPLVLKSGTIEDTIISYVDNAVVDMPVLDESIAGNVTAVRGDGDIQKYRDYMSLITLDNFHKYQDWYKIQRASANIGIAFEVYDEFMMKYHTHYGASSYYNRQENRDAYEQPNKSKFVLGWRHIFNLAEKCNPDAKKELDKKYSVDRTAYKYVKAQFEKEHIKIINKAFYVKETEDDFLFFTEAKMRASYRHLKCLIKNKKDEEVYAPFIECWFDDQWLRVKTDIDIYPQDVKCPDHIYNLWKPFAASLLPPVQKPHNDAVLYFRNHIKVLCGNSDIVATYFEKWIGQMLMHPSIKTICPIFISEEGAGKGNLVNLMRRLLGYKRVFETEKPERDVWGTFNSAMKDAYFVVLNELSKKSTLDGEGSFKALITDPYITISEKGIPAYTVKSYHRTMGCTNVEDPFKTDDGDRRKMIVRSSDELIGNKPYFVKFNEYLDDDTAIRSFYDYLVALPDLDKFHLLPIPETEYHKELKSSYKSPIELWVPEYAKTVPNETVRRSSAELFDSFVAWKRSCEITYECNIIKFAMRLKNLNITGITKDPSSYNRGFFIDGNALRSKYGLGLIINIKNDDGDDGFGTDSDSL